MVQFTVLKSRRNLFGGARGFRIRAIRRNRAQIHSIDGVDHSNASIPLRTIADIPRAMATLLWILAVILVVAGIFAIIRRQLLWGIVLIVVGLLVGPGGVSIFHV